MAYLGLLCYREFLKAVQIYFTQVHLGIPCIRLAVCVRHLRSMVSAVCKRVYLGLQTHIELAKYSALIDACVVPVSVVQGRTKEIVVDCALPTAVFADTVMSVL